MDLTTVKQKALETYYPSEKELKEADQIFQKISDFIYEEHGLKSHFAGSAGRQTCRKGDKDVDIFILFPESTSRKELEQKGLEIGKSVFKEFGGEHHVEYAEHPYTKGDLLEHEIEIVPCIDTAPDQIRTSVDRTPHHTRWVKENLDENQKKDVVALKAFLDAQNLYSSSLKTQGFSGYLCEVLIAYYGSFEQLITSSKSWEQQERIQFEESEKEFNSNFVVVDPVDPNRNVAAVLSDENYAKYIFEAWKLDQKPSRSKFSSEAEFSEFELKQELKRRSDILVLEFQRPKDEVDDIIYPQLRKLERRINQKIQKADFRIFESGVHADEEKCRIFFELNRTLPEVEIIKGPKVFHNERHIEQFHQKYENTFVKNQRVCAKTQRRFLDAQELIKNFLEGDIEQLRQKGVPNQLAPHVKESKFSDPLEGEEKWLKYLYRKFNL